MPAPLSRRRLIGLAGLAALASIAACGGNDPNAATTTVAMAPGTTEAPVFTNPSTTVDPSLNPVSGGSLIVGLDAESPGYHPHVDPWGNGGHVVAKAIFDSLASYDAAGKVVPYLAESIEANADATVWTNDLTADYVHENSAYST